LVIGARGPAGPSLEEKLRTHGALTFFPETETLAQIDAMVLGLGDRTEHTSDAKQLVDAMHAREDAVANAVRALPRPRVLLIFGLTPTVVAGPNSFADEVITRAGGENAVKQGGPYPVLGMEQVMTLDPDIVLNAAIAEAHGAERITNDTPGWSSIGAVKHGKVVPLTDESVLRPGPRVGNAIAIVARAIHPGVVIP
jgi:iron complex transport system substrate-binding protein